MKKVLSSALALMLVLSMLSFTVSAEDINTIPQVGQMSINLCNKSIGAAVRTNGTINVYGVPYVRETAAFLEQVKTVTNAIDVACTTDNIVFVLKDTGKVEMLKVYEEIDTFSYDPTAGWENIVAIESGYNHIVGLKTDGTVVATGPNRNGECDVDGFKNIKTIVASNYVTLCINNEGRIFSAGQNPYTTEMASWPAIKDISIGHFVLGGSSYIVAVTTDGDVITQNSSSYGTMTINHNDVVLYPVREDGTLDWEHPLPFGKFVDAQAYGDTGFYAVNEFGNCYFFAIDRTQPGMCIVQDVHSMSAISGGSTMYPNQYCILDNNGKIHSSLSAFDSDSWILTTNITYNGQKVESDVPPYIKDGRTLAPIRAILEALGMQISWDDVTQTVTATKDGVTITVSIDSNIATVNGEQKTLDVPAEITRDRTFVPVRFFVEALGMKVEWNQDTQTVIITQE